MSITTREEEQVNLTNECIHLLDGLNDGLLWVNKFGDIVQVNAAFVRMTGYEKADIEQKKVFLYFREISMLSWELYWRKMKEGDKPEAEGRVVDKAGILKPVHIKFNGISSKRDLACLVVQDVAYNISDSQRLKRVSYEYDRLMYRTSHDLKAPISTILGLVELVKRDATSNQRECLSLIEKTIRKQNALMGDINHLAFIESSRVVLDRVDIEALTKSIISGCLIDNPKGSQIEWELDFNTKIPFTSDENLLSKALSPLIKNAIEYKRENAPDCRISIHVLITEQTLTFNIEDNGIGIYEDLHKKIFDMFYRGTERSTGSGLGLYVSLITTYKLKGHVELVESSEGKTVFQLVVPNKFCVRSKAISHEL
ncbi:PAS domain-containing sensor histidine kinase [Fulvivirga maritima]|uniref:PAS domain-containing sensor histidine kinase n=1 Tax=Fulvivirga maritima TaxID=2904247 RepID=UPI001F172BB5|nr:PAS domain-containing sensor histidine kinase [Fulvivirga maritima]UII25148.1 PAS domain-containing sensor histidine kinase [Fulvivirga maritima]